MNSILVIGIVLIGIFVSFFILGTFVGTILDIIEDIIAKDFDDIVFHIFVFLVMGILSLIIIGSWIEFLQAVLTNPKICDIILSQ